MLQRGNVWNCFGSHFSFEDDLILLVPSWTGSPAGNMQSPWNVRKTWHFFALRPSPDGLRLNFLPLKSLRERATFDHQDYLKMLWIIRKTIYVQWFYRSWRRSIENLPLNQSLLVANHVNNLKPESISLNVCRQSPSKAPARRRSGLKVLLAPEGLHNSHPATFR